MEVFLRILIMKTYLYSVKGCFTELPIYCLTDIIVEQLKVNLIKTLFDNRIQKNHTQNADFDDLTFDGDEGLIFRQLLNSINDDILFRLINGSIIYIKTNLM